MRLLQRRLLPPHPSTAMSVTENLSRQVLVAPYDSLNKKKHCQTSCDLEVIVPGQRFSDEIAKLGARPVCLRKRIVVATVAPEDVFACLLVTNEAAT